MTYDQFGRMLITITVALFGACVGSFLNVCIYRIPRDESIVTPRSHCPHCNRLIPWYLNIPVLSWLMLLGRCRYCKGTISPRYILVEILTAVLFLGVLFQSQGFPRVLDMGVLYDWRLVPVYILFIGGLILGTFVDFEHMIIPDSVTIGGTIAGLILSPLVPAMHNQHVWYLGLMGSAIGALVGGGLLWLVAFLGEKAFKKEAMGMGDVKLMAAVGAFLGWKAVIFTLIVGSFIGSIVGVSLIIIGRAKLQGRLPFGPYLSLGALLWIYWGPLLMAGYLHLLGRG
jgi:leader peptidase (prepilin peptidase)/N-methyltransferase